jgi:hypothetical protein
MADGKTIGKTYQILSTSSTPSTMPVGLATVPGIGVTCQIGINPTSADVGMGSIGIVPHGGIAWEGTGDSHTIINGSAVWP